ncbi:hypothetical protein [Azospirillum sp. ST 5-10]
MIEEHAFAAWKRDIDGRATARTDRMLDRLDALPGRRRSDVACSAVTNG